MAELFRNAHVIDAIVALMALEGVGLWLLHQLRGIGPAPAQFAFNLGAGAALLLALHAALTATPWPVMALFLLLALGAHVLDLKSRFRRTQAQNSKPANAGLVP